MKRISDDQKEPVARLLAECFIDEPVTAYQIRGIENEHDFLTKLFSMQLEIYSKTKDVFVMDESITGVIIGAEKKKTKWYREFFASISASSKLRQDISKTVYKTYTNNLKAVLKEIDLSWQKEFVHTNYYHLNIMAVESKQRGKGYAKKLITPIIDRCKDKNIPITLETANKDQIGLYEHFGFDLVKTINGDQTGINQYCFLMQHEA